MYAIRSYYVRRLNLICDHANKYQGQSTESKDIVKNFENDLNQVSDKKEKKKLEAKINRVNSSLKEWSDTISIPDDEMTRWMLAFIDLNRFTKRGFRSFLGLRNQVWNRLGILNNVITSYSIHYTKLYE